MVCIDTIRFLERRRKVGYEDGEAFWLFAERKVMGWCEWRRWDGIGAKDIMTVSELPYPLEHRPHCDDIFFPNRKVSKSHLLPLPQPPYQQSNQYYPLATLLHQISEFTSTPDGDTFRYTPSSRSITV